MAEINPAPTSLRPVLTPADTDKIDVADVSVNDLNDDSAKHAAVVSHAPVKIHTEVLRRQLKSRHSSMIALGGAIGTGLILTSGVGLARAGPVGLLIAFLYVGSLCYGMMCALGEMAAFLPHQRGFAGHGSRFVSEGWGGMTGITYYCKYLISTGTSWSGGATILNYWLPPSKVSNAVWISIFLVIALSVQFVPVRYFGEFEFWMCTAKITVLLGLMVFAIVIDLGGGPNHDRWGFRTWRDLPFGEYLETGGTGKLLGFLAALVTAVYSYTGTEMVGVALGEMSNPQKSISTAIRACFYRIIILYCGSIFLIGLIVPANSPMLLTANKHSANANASPFVVAIKVAGIKALPSIVNACMLLFILSGSNSDIYINSRTLYGMAADGHAPKIFAKVNRYGNPWINTTISLAFACLGYTTVNASSLTTFKYFVSAVTLFSTIAWISIVVSHIRMMAACKAQGISRDQLPYKSRFQPYLSWYTLIGTIIISLTKGFDTLVHKFSAKGFVVAYIALPVAILSYLFYGFKYKSWFIKAEDVDLVTETRLKIETLDEDNLVEPHSVKRGFMKAVRVFWTD